MQSEDCQWQITGELGRGSYGSVYCLTYSPSHSQCPMIKYALKLLEQPGGSAQDTELAYKELRIMGSLSHPSIVALVDAFQLDHRLLLLLELCQGGDLRHFLDDLKAKRRPKTFQKSGVEESLAVRWTQQLASGLQYMHQKKILHRDLKPQNIFLKDKFTLKIGDLGIARQLVFTREMAATHIGTPLYISPEIYQGNSYSYKTDVWSLGCCIYEMMTLEYAFHAPSRFELVGKVVNKQVLPLPGFYSRPMQTLVLSMLHKAPEDRPTASHILQSVQEMDGMSPQPERKPWEQEDLDTGRSEKPRDSKSLQRWRLEMAEALNSFLNKKWAAQSAQLAAALGQKLSLASIKDLDGSGEKVSSRRDQQRERHKVHRSKPGGSDISNDDNEGIESSLLNFSDTVSSGESMDTLSSSQSSTKATQKIRSNREETQEEVSHVGRVRSKTKPLLRKRREHANKNDHMQLQSNEGDHYVDTRDAGFPETSSQPRHIQVGKSSMIIKSRPLPHPKLSRDVSHGGDLTGSCTDLLDNDAGSLHYTSFSSSGSQFETEDSDGFWSNTGHTSGTDSTQQNDSTLDGSGRLSTPHSFFSQSVQHHHTHISPNSAQQNHSNGSPIHGDPQEIHRAYANEVIAQVRGKLMTLASLNVKAADGPSDRGEGTPISSEELGLGNSVGQTEGQMEDMEPAEAGNKVKKPRGKKKRNFLKEMSSKEPSDQKNSAVKAAQVEEEKPSVTLFTRAQRVTFSNLCDDQQDFSIDLDSFS